MKYPVKSSSPLNQKTDCIAVTVYQGGKPGTLASETDAAAGGVIGAILQRDGFEGKAGDVLLIPHVEGIKAKLPDMPVEMGMAGEMVMGLHGELDYDGQRLAGMFPHEQVAVAAKAGVDIFGVAVNSDTAQSTPYNLARTVTYLKAATSASPIPVHANSGMGVGGMPMTLLPPMGRSTRCAKALVEIGKADGL